MILDAHQHFWAIGRGDYGWLTADQGVIFRDFGPEDLLPLMDEAGVARSILVQAAPTRAETTYLLELADRTPNVAGVVGWEDFEAADAPHRLEELAGRGKLVGLRPMLQDLADDAWLLRPDLQDCFRVMAEVGLTLDALVKPRHLSVLRRFLDLHPGLRVVVDHGAKPDIAQDGLETWAEAIRAIGADGRTYAKFSGLVTEAASGWSLEDIRPYAQVLFEAFGERLMWGSDWPVLNQASDYPNWLNVSRTLAQDLTEARQDSLFSAAAARFYGI